MAFKNGGIGGVQELGTWSASDPGMLEKSSIFALLGLSPLDRLGLGGKQSVSGTDAAGRAAQNRMVNEDLIGKMDANRKLGAGAEPNLPKREKIRTGEAQTAALVAAIARLLGAKNAPQELVRYFTGLQNYRDEEYAEGYQKALNAHNKQLRMYDADMLGLKDQLGLENADYASFLRNFGYLDPDEEGVPEGPPESGGDMGDAFDLRHGQFFGDADTGGETFEEMGKRFRDPDFGRTRVGQTSPEDQMKARLGMDYSQMLGGGKPEEPWSFSGSPGIGERGGEREDAPVLPEPRPQAAPSQAVPYVKGGQLTKLQVSFFNPEQTANLERAYLGAEKAVSGGSRKQAAKILGLKIGDYQALMPKLAGDPAKQKELKSLMANLSQWQKELLDFGGDALGTPYSWGGGGANGPSRGIEHGRNTRGFDCSGFTEYVAYKQWRKQIPGTCVLQFNALPKVEMAHVREGDFLYWSNGKGTKWHTGVLVFKNGVAYLRNAPQTGDVVKDVRLSDFMKRTGKRFRGARRASEYRG